MPASHRSLAALLAAALVLACADSSDPARGTLPDEPLLARAAETPIITRVAVSPTSASLTGGQTRQFTATAYNKRGRPVSGLTFTWASSAPSVATVSASGLVTAQGAGTASITATTGGITGSSLVTVTATPPTTATLVAAGDIAVCTTSFDEATGALVAGIPGTVAVLGDNAYPNGSATDYANCYHPSWGPVKSRTRPAVGNHEYQTANASGYFGYFGAAAGDPAKGYYSYDLGDWHVVVLNSNCTIVSCAAGSAQEQWLRADLAATSRACVLAYWHHPRFNSGASHGNDLNVAPFWNALYAAGAEIVLNGHEHLYERFAPQTPAAAADPATGIRQFTVGTGGKALYTIGTIQPNSEVRNASSYGVLELTLGTGTYAWNFRPISGQVFTDSGTGSCH